MNAKQRYWIVVASKDHVKKAVTGGFIQANHGKKAPMQKLRKGDRIICYSSKEKFKEAQPYQKFTAIGTVNDEEPRISDIMHHMDRKSYCRSVAYDPCQEVEIRLLIDALDFIPNKRKWGFPFRRGFFEINKEDYITIANTMIQHE